MLGVEAGSLLVAITSGGPSPRLITSILYKTGGFFQSSAYVTAGAASSEFHVVSSALLGKECVVHLHG